MGIIGNHWNKAVREAREDKVRDYVRASEIGKPMVDRYLSMRGTPVSNPFSEATLRVFGAGNVVEFIVMRTLAMAGVLNRTQADLVLPEGPDNLRVTGRLDATIGGVTDWDQAMERVKENLAQYSLGVDKDLNLHDKAVSIIEGLKDEYPEGMDEMLVEVKSISNQAYWGGKVRDEDGRFEGYLNNKLQLYAYLLMTGLEQGILLYVSKDDFRLEEIIIRANDKRMADLFWEDLRTITRYVREGVMPPLEPEIVYNAKKGIFEENPDVSRSLYLTYAYGYDSERQFYATNHPEVLDRNRALKHIREEKVDVEDLALIAKYDLMKYV